LPGEKFPVRWGLIQLKTAIPQAEFSLVVALPTKPQLVTEGKLYIFNIAERFPVRNPLQKKDSILKKPDKSFLAFREPHFMPIFAGWREESLTMNFEEKNHMRSLISITESVRDRCSNGSVDSLACGSLSYRNSVETVVLHNCC
jgi:hypothetical protein